MKKEKKIKIEEMSNEELLERFEHLNCIRGQQVLQAKEDPDLFADIYLIKYELKRRLYAQNLTKNLK